MRAVNIRIITGSGGLKQMKASFRKNWIHYLQEALGLAIFMVSACFFGSMLFAKTSSWQLAIPNEGIRNLIMAVMMGLTALFIFYSPFTAGSGSHINPAVTLSFLRLGKMCPYDALFYIVFQFLGGIAAVYAMAWLLAEKLTAAPVQYVVTVPGKAGVWLAALVEFLIAFIMLSMVLFTSANKKWKRYTRIIAACLVCVYVELAGPVSGFGMNPARTLASAIPAHNYDAIWVYIIIPFAGMLLATECFLLIQSKQMALE